MNPALRATKPATILLFSANVHGKSFVSTATEQLNEELLKPIVPQSIEEEQESDTLTSAAL
tara:strand:- start:16 stop:198 length:183 start_codon:yes stop_codon:yes gene_type:complete